MITNKEKDAQATAALFAIAEQNKIVANNNAQILKHNKEASLLEFAQQTNDRMFEEYSNELLRVASSKKLDTKLEANIQESKANINEGITSGSSKARAARVFAIKKSKAINDINEQTNSIISKVADQRNKQNDTLEAQKIQAYNTMLSNLTTGANAALQIQEAKLKGYAQGYKVGESKDNLEQSTIDLNKSKENFLKVQ